MLVDTADIIEDIRFVKLEHVLNWKRMMGREKDLKDIGLIETYLHQQKGLDSSYFLG
jgi:hypothetical protein